MNIVINSQILAAELRLLAKIVPAKPVIAVLSHVLLKTDAEVVHLHATDLEISLRTQCRARIIQPGIVAVPISKFLAMVERFPDDDVEILVNEQHIQVRCGAFQSKLQALRALDFPQLPEVEGTTNTLDAETLQWLIARTRYAVAVTSAKYVLQGALLALTGPVAAMVATDSKQLALATIGRRTGTDQKAIIPMKALDVLSGSLLGGSVDVTIGTRHLFFSSGGRLLTSRTLEGEFPKYDRVIPRDNDKTLTINRQMLAAALRRVVLTAEENLAVHFTITSGTLELSSASAGIGSASEVVQIDYDGAPLKVCMNGEYVLNFLEAASNQAITMSLKDEKSAALFADGTDYLAVVMLMRT